MKWIKGLWGKVARYFASGRAQRDIETAARLVPQALAVVEEIAKLTPTRSDDELVALFKAKAIAGVERYLALPPQDRGLVLLQAATKILGATLPLTPSRIIQTAVQLAYTGWRADQKALGD